MTHTLHRVGGGDDFTDDYIVTAMPAKGLNDTNCIPKLQRVLRTALKYNPVNIGNSIKGAAHRATKDLRPTVHWHRDDSPDPEAVIAEVDRATTVSAVFDKFENAQAFVAELKEIDLGLSVNIASATGKALECCDACDLKRHSVEFSLGFQGATEKLANHTTTRVSTMCGHGMISAAFAGKMIDWVRSGRRTPGQACAYMARFCVCGSFNPSRAERILAEAAEGR
jgi:hypothetical protein